MKIPYFSEMPNFELKKAHIDDAGYDLPIWDERLVNGEWSTTGEYTLQPFESKKFKTGIYLGLPTGPLPLPMKDRHKSYGELDTRSGTSDHVLILLCHTIDSPYRGNIRLAILNLNQKPVTIKNGVRLAQIIVHPFDLPHYMSKCDTLEQFLEEAGTTERGDKGFNSTGGGLGQ